jgi:hypothetical protein
MQDSGEREHHAEDETDEEPRTNKIVIAPKSIKVAPILFDRA